jgi:hypothetical protein
MKGEIKMLFPIDDKHFINTQQIVWVYPDYVGCRLQFFMTDKNSYFKTYDFFDAQHLIKQDLDFLLNNM